MRNRSEDITIGNKIRFLRTMRGLSQETVAKALDVSFQQVQKYEKGTNSIKASKIPALAKLFEVPASAIFDEANEKETGGQVAAAIKEEVPSSRQAIELMRAFNRVPSNLKKPVLGLVRSIANNEVMCEA